MFEQELVQEMLAARGFELFKPTCEAGKQTAMGASWDVSSWDEYASPCFDSERIERGHASWNVCLSNVPRCRYATLFRFVNFTTGKAVVIKTAGGSMAKVTSRL